MALPAVLAGIAALSPVVLPLARRVLFGLGFGLVTYGGMTALLNGVEGQVQGYLGQTSASILALLGLAKVDQAITMVFAAFGIKLGFMGLNAAGNLVRPRWKWND